MTNTYYGTLARSLKRFELLLVNEKRVFTTQDLATIWNLSDKITLYSNIQYYVATKKLKRVYKGVYAVGEYTELELANKLLSPSYISFYTALAAHGIIYQYYEAIHSMALVSKVFEVDKKNFSYHQIKEEVFFDPTGVKEELTSDNRVLSRMASPERAVCDSLYLVPGLSFDNLRPVNLTKLAETAKLYKNNRLEKEVMKLILIERANAR